MKKAISIILLCSLLLACFSGCSIPDNTGGGIDEGNAPTELQGKDNELVLALVKYLRELFIDYDLASVSTEQQIDMIKKGSHQALHVAFDSTSYYFVCGYHSCDHNNESVDFQCADEYTWVRFEDETQISEYYNNKKFVVAFQINKSSFVTDIMSDSAGVPDMEHFQLYEPSFSIGMNTNPHIVFDQTFIYLHPKDNDTVYYATSAYHYHSLYSIPCIRLDGQYYITTYISTLYSTGQYSETTLLGYDFGKYFDDLVSIMNTDKYSVTNDDGSIRNYGLIRIDDFADCVAKQ